MQKVGRDVRLFCLIKLNWLFYIKEIDFFVFWGIIYLLSLILDWWHVGFKSF